MGRALLDIVKRGLVRIETDGERKAERRSGRRTRTDPIDQYDRSLTMIQEQRVNEATAFI
jgi:hypothetical protein